MKLVSIIIVFLSFSCSFNKSKDSTTLIENQLNNVLRDFGETNNGFIFSVFHEDTCQIQIVHRSFVEVLKHEDNSFGFALNLTFNPSVESDKTVLQNFKKMKVSNDFTSYNWDGIPCYAIDLKSDVKEASILTTKILNKLYNLDENSNLTFDIVDQGRM